MDQVRILLAPWSDISSTLGKLHRPQDDDGDKCIDDDGVLWFRWMPSREPVQCARQVELLTVLAMLVRVNRDAFEQILSEIGGEYGAFFVKNRARYKEPYLLGVYLLIEDALVMAQVQEVLDGASMALQSDYVRVKNALISQIKAPSALLPEIHMKIDFTAEAGSPSWAISSSLALVRRQRASMNSDPDREPRWPLTLRSVQFDFRDDMPLAGNAMAQLRELVDRGIGVTKMMFGSPFHSVEDATGLQHAEIVRTIHTLFGPREIPTTSKSEWTASVMLPRLAAVQLTTSMPKNLLVGICTAMAQTQTLQKIEIEQELVANAANATTTGLRLRQLWCGVAYALFSSEASSSSITALEVDADTLAEIDVDVLRHIASSADPFLAFFDPRAALFQTPPPVAMNWVVDIQAQVEILLMKESPGAIQCVGTFTPATDLTGLRVLAINEEMESMQLIRPGWGVCQVSRLAAGVQLRQAESPSWRTTSGNVEMARTSPRGVSHLVLNYISQATVDVSLAFLAFVGVHVRKLDLVEPDEDVDMTAFITNALQRCPQLKSLTLFAMELASLRPLLGAFRDGICYPQQLQMRRVRIHDVSSVHAFFEALGDPQHPLAVHLKKLSFHIYDNGLQVPSRGPMIQSCVRMLHTNHTLLQCRAITLSKKRALQFADVFTKFDLQPLAIQKAPLSLASKLTFLGSLALSSTALPMEAGRRHHHFRLDTFVVAKIFQFAADHEVRRCSLEIPMEAW